MKKLFISQPMRGKTDEEILKERKALIADTDISAIRMNLPEYYSKTNAIIPNSAIEGELNYRETVGELSVKKYDAASAKKMYDSVKEYLSGYGEDGGIDFGKIGQILLLVQ